MHGRMHPNYWQITILLVVDLYSSLAYFMMTHPLPIAGKMPIKTLVAKQLPTNLDTCEYIISTYIHVHVGVAIYEYSDGVIRVGLALALQIIVTPRACARGKAIGLSVCCHCRCRCRHENCQIDLAF